MIQEDGIHTLIIFGVGPKTEGIVFKEKRLKPPGFDGGGPIDLTSLRNLVVRTYAAKRIYRVTDATIVVEWDPILYNRIRDNMLVEQAISIQFPDGELFDIYGYLDKFEPGESVEGDQPLATITVVVTNRDLEGNENTPNLLTAA